MERCRLFDERLASANEELSLLQQPRFKHPELLAMKEAVDQHCNQKIAYEQKLLKYKLQALQKASVATKHQIHSQYMQTASIIRERSLEQLNEELYQVQRERRSCEGDIPDYMFAFTPQRPQQILQQSAYNHEVSVLSGVAKYVGFPAAPMVRQARSDELEDDMRSMGVRLSSYLMQGFPFTHALLRSKFIPSRHRRIEQHRTDRTFLLRQRSRAIHRLWRMDFSRETRGPILNTLPTSSNVSKCTDKSPSSRMRPPQHPHLECQKELQICPSLMAPAPPSLRIFRALARLWLQRQPQARHVQFSHQRGTRIQATAPRMPLRVE